MPAEEPSELHKVLRAGGAPGADPEARKLVLAAMPGFEPSGNNWLHFDFCNQFLQTFDELADATAELVCTQYGEDNVRVLEVRFCPTLHVLEALDAERAVEAVVAGYSRGAMQATGLEVGAVGGIVGGVIVCALRTNPPEHGVACCVYVACDPCYV